MGRFSEEHGAVRKTTRPPANRLRGHILEEAEFALCDGGHSGLSRDFLVLVAKAGIESEAVARARGDGIEGGRKFRALSCHSLRHTFNSMLANAGVDQEVRQQLTGHASPEINRRNTHLELKTMRAAISKLPMWRTIRPTHS